MSNKTITCAIFAEKGGVGKTTLSVNCAHALSLSGYKTLLIDLDGQNNAAKHLGFDRKQRDILPSFYELTDRRNTSIKVPDVIHNARENLDIIFNKNMYLINREIVGDNPYTYLSTHFKDLNDLGYSIVLIDCGPTESTINTAILNFVDYIFVPVELATFAMDGLADTYTYLQNIEVSIEKIRLFIPNKLNKSESQPKKYLQQLQELGERFNVTVTSPIGKRAILYQAIEHGQTAFEYDQEAAKEFIDVVKEVVNLIEK